MDWTQLLSPQTFAYAVAFYLLIRMEKSFKEFSEKLETNFKQLGDKIENFSITIEKRLDENCQSIAVNNKLMTLFFYNKLKNKEAEEKCPTDLKQ